VTFIKWAKYLARLLFLFGGEGLWWVEIVGCVKHGISVVRWSSGSHAGPRYPSSRVQTQPKLSDFFGRKNPQHAFLWKGSKAVCPMSQIFSMLKNPVITWKLDHRQNLPAMSHPISSLANRGL
jgi:hypothetical protein